MKYAFEQHGIEVFGWTDLLDEPQLIHFCKEFKPDAIFEMNRSRANLPNLPRHIIHIAWIVDLGHHEINDFSGSQILYFFNKRWLQFANNNLADIVSWLPPGYCPLRYKMQRKKKTIDFSFAGHIPGPWTQNELDRKISISSESPHLTFRDIAELCCKNWKIKDQPIIALNALRNSPIISPKTLSEISKCMVNDRILKYDINCRIGRAYSRERLIDLALQVSGSLRIVGSPSWKLWPEYEKYYAGYVSKTEELSTLYQSSRINLHEGVSLHMRLFDCMGAGGCLLYLRQSGFDFSQDPIHTYFEENQHYILADTDDFIEVTKSYLRDDKKRENIAFQAARLVESEHIWSKRMERIVDDVKKLI